MQLSRLQDRFLCSELGMGLATTRVIRHRRRDVKSQSRHEVAVSVHLPRYPCCLVAFGPNERLLRIDRAEQLPRQRIAAYC